MNKTAYFRIVIAGLPLAIGIFILFAPEFGFLEASPDQYVTKIFNDAGVQMELPVMVPFESDSPKGVLIMLHPISPGQHAEQGYLVKINVRWFSKSETDSNARIASNPLTDDFNKWLNTKHPTLDIRKGSKDWRVRKDIETSDGRCLSIDCQLTVTDLVNTNLAEIKRIVDSIKPQR
jgi:hypothetical protein